MKPPATQAPSEDEEEEDENERTVVTKQAKGKKKSKGRTPKIPAGLALMHGFSATNVGKSRLTVRLDVCDNLQHGLTPDHSWILGPRPASLAKGKPRRRQQRDNNHYSRVHFSTSMYSYILPSDLVRCVLSSDIRQHGFSEELFLRDTKKKASRRKDRRPIQDDSDDSDDSSHSSSSSSTLPLAVRKKTPKHKSVKRTKGSPQPAKPSYAHNLKSSSTSPTPKRPSGPVPSYPENTESEVWDIELEGNALPSGSGVSVTSQDKVTRSPSGTVLSSPPPHQVLAMNTLLAPFRPEPHSDSNTVQLELRHPASHNGNARSYASLAPSESASQVHPRVPIKEPNLATRSRFFANVPKGPPKPDPTSVETKTVEEHLQHPLESLDQPASVVSRNNDAQRPVISDLLPSHYSVTRSRHSSHRPHSAPMSDQHVPPAGCSSPSSLEQALADLTDPPGQESCLGTSFTYLLHDECNSGVGVMPTPRYRYHLPPSSHSPVLQSWEEHDLTAYDDDYGPQTPSPHGQDEVTEADIDALAHPNFYGYPTYSHEVDSINPAHPDDVLMADPLFDSYDDHSADDNANLTARDDDLINDVRDYEEEEDIVFQGDFHSTQTTNSSHYVNDTIALDMSEDYMSGDDIGMEVQNGEAWGLQGRELLLGLGHGNDGRFDVARGQSTWSGGVWQAEEDVARRLKNHWLPQSF